MLFICSSRFRVAVFWKRKVCLFDTQSGEREKEEENTLSFDNRDCGLSVVQIFCDHKLCTPNMFIAFFVPLSPKYTSMLTYGYHIRAMQQSSNIF
jgi:hypothetical protein